MNTKASLDSLTWSKTYETYNLISCTASSSSYDYLYLLSPRFLSYLQTFVIGARIALKNLISGTGGLVKLLQIQQRFDFVPKPYNYSASSNMFTIPFWISELTRIFLIFKSLVPDKLAKHQSTWFWIFSL